MFMLVCMTLLYMQSLAYAAKKTKKEVKNIRRKETRKQNSLPMRYSSEYQEYKDQLNDDILKDMLTVKNYRKKFHHLLCHEEAEHAQQLEKR